MKKGFLLAILGIFLCFGQSFAATINITVIEDAYKNPDGSTGNNDSIGTSFATLLKFPVSGISFENITSVTLNLYCWYATLSGGTTAYYAGNGWTETWIPASIVSEATTAIGSNGSGGSAIPGWLTWNLALTPEMLVNGTLSIALKETTPGGYHLFRSSEYSDHTLSPYLGVTTSAVPVPPSVWLLGSGLLGLVGLRRKFASYLKR